MSNTYTVSTLSSIESVDVAALRSALGVKPGARAFAYPAGMDSKFSHATPPNIIQQWWRTTESEHISQLVEPVIWDETSKFSETRDVYAGQEIELANLIALIDRTGLDDIARRFRARPRNTYGLDEDLFFAAQKRGFAVLYPQVFVGAAFYLPFKANLILEVPDWRGETTRFGSLTNYERELEEVLAVIGKADPKAAIAGQQDIKHDDRLSGAYNAARIQAELARVGLRQNLPFWYSE